MSKIDINVVQRIAQLSGLSLSEAEKLSALADIRNIIDMFDSLDELDVSAIQPTYQVVDLVNVDRPDIVEDDGVSREQLLELSYSQQDNCIKVPKVL